MYVKLSDNSFKKLFFEQDISFDVEKSNINSRIADNKKLIPLNKINTLKSVKEKSTAPNTGEINVTIDVMPSLMAHICCIPLCPNSEFKEAVIVTSKTVLIAFRKKVNKNTSHKLFPVTDKKT